MGGFFSLYFCFLFYLFFIFFFIFFFVFFFSFCDKNDKGKSSHDISSNPQSATFNLRGRGVQKKLLIHGMRNRETLVSVKREKKRTFARVWFFDGDWENIIGLGRNMIPKGTVSSCDRERKANRDQRGRNSRRWCGQVQSFCFSLQSMDESYLKPRETEMPSLCSDDFIYAR